MPSAMSRRPTRKNGSCLRYGTDKGERDSERHRLHRTHLVSGRRLGVHQVVMVIVWRMFDEPRNADKQHDQYEDDEDPELNGGVLPPLDPAYPFA